MKQAQHSNAEGLQKQRTQVASIFEDQFAFRPDWISCAPGRVNLMGEHTDYNDGFVLPMAINRYVVIAGGVSKSKISMAYSTAFDECHQLDLDNLRGLKNGNWSNHLRGVILGFNEAAVQIGPMNFALASNVPIGGGLSSSAAIGVATATLLEAATKSRLDLKKKARIAQLSEHEYVGVACGIMDQFASAMCIENHLMLLDCKTADVQMIPFSNPTVAVLIADSGVKHALSAGEYRARQMECELASQYFSVNSLRELNLESLDAEKNTIDASLFRRAHHILTENDRTLKMVEALSSHSWEVAGNLMLASHESLRDNYDVSCYELDVLVDIAQDIGTKGGVYGSRMTGGGFGGCTVTLVEKDAVPEITERMKNCYFQMTGIESNIFESLPSRGAHMLSCGLSR